MQIETFFGRGALKACSRGSDSGEWCEKMFSWRRYSGSGPLEKARAVLAIASDVKKVSFKISFKPKYHHRNTRFSLRGFSPKVYQNCHLLCNV